MTPHLRSACQAGRTLTAVAAVALAMGALAGPADAQTNPTPTTTVPIVTTTSGPNPSTGPTVITVPLGPATTSAPSTTVAASTTTTPTITAPTIATPDTTQPGPASSAAVSAPPWTAAVPGPPPPPPVPAGATPADVARAGQLEARIVSQSEALDIAAERYDVAEQSARDAASHVADVQAQLAAATDRAATLAASRTEAEAALRQAAVDAYIHGAASEASSLQSGVVAAYEHELSDAVVQTALTRAHDRVRQLETARRQLVAAQDALATDRQKAEQDNAVAQAAAQGAQAAAQAAALQQAQLLATIAQVQGNLPGLVAAADAVQAQAAFARFSTLNTLDFNPVGPLLPPLAQSAAALQAALAEVGKPYVWGAAGPDSFDCSGLTEWSWKQAGIAIPRVAADQQAWATPVPISQIQPGDLVFFGAPAHHVGIYVGNGKMVDAPHSGASVEVVPIWWRDLSGFGRVHQP